jgi:hypothetical protein
MIAQISETEAILLPLEYRVSPLSYRKERYSFMADIRLKF